MKKRIFAILFLVLFISGYALILTSCGGSSGFRGISAYVTDYSQLGSVDGNSTAMRIGVQITNHEEVVVDGCVLTFRFYDNNGNLLATMRENMDIFIDPHGIYGGSVTLQGYGDTFSNTARVEVSPYSITWYEMSEGCDGCEDCYDDCIDCGGDCIDILEDCDGCETCVEIFEACDGCGGCADLIEDCDDCDGCDGCGLDDCNGCSFFGGILLVFAIAFVGGIIWGLFFD